MDKKYPRIEIVSYFQSSPYQVRAVLKFSDAEPFTLDGCTMTILETPSAKLHIASLRDRFKAHAEALHCEFFIDQDADRIASGATEEQWAKVNRVIATHFKVVRDLDTMGLCGFICRQQDFCAENDIQVQTGQFVGNAIREAIKSNPKLCDLWLAELQMSEIESCCGEVEQRGEFDNPSVGSREWCDQYQCIPVPVISPDQTRLNYSGEVVKYSWELPK